METPYPTLSELSAQAVPSNKQWTQEVLDQQEWLTWLGDAFPSWLGVPSQELVSTPTCILYTVGAGLETWDYLYPPWAIYLLCKFIWNSGVVQLKPH